MHYAKNLQSAENFLETLYRGSFAAAMPNPSSLPEEVRYAANLGLKLAPIPSHSRFVSAALARVGYPTFDCVQLRQWPLSFPAATGLWPRTTSRSLNTTRRSGDTPCASFAAATGMAGAIRCSSDPATHASCSFAILGRGCVYSGRVLSASDCTVRTWSWSRRAASSPVLGWSGLISPRPSMSICPSGCWLRTTTMPEGILCPRFLLIFCIRKRGATAGTSTTIDRHCNPSVCRIKAFPHTSGVEAGAHGELPLRRSA